MKRVEELSLLYDISQQLESSVDLNAVVHPITETLTTRINLLHCAITLVDRGSKEIITETASGLTMKQRVRGTYKVGEGITGEVVASGQQKIIPNIGKDPSFLDRFGLAEQYAGSTVSFICVPVKINNETIGTLSTHLKDRANEDLENTSQLLTVIATMIAQAVRLRRDFIEEKRKLEAENTRLQQVLGERFKPSNIIGNSAAIQQVYDLVAQVCRSDTTVIIRGESGTGKELVAQAIHYNSDRKQHAFIRVNCAALPEALIESELFGHEKGAFSGAIQKRTGRFEQASNGTIFLDEIGDVPLSIQIKLLRVLQEREFERVGGNQTIHCNVRVIVATNKNLEDEIKAQTFREDLYFRLNVFPIHMPPLRERKSDIMLLADHFIEKYSTKNNKVVNRLSTAAIDMLMAYHWPGNIRELENIMERAVLLATDGTIYVQHLPPSLQFTDAPPTPHGESLQDILDAVEKEKIIDAIKTSQGNLSKAAKLLKVTNRQIGLRVDKYRINYMRYRK